MSWLAIQMGLVSTQLWTMARSPVFWVIAGVLLLLAISVARQARARGYSFTLWLVASVVTLNPILTLVLLAALPDARRMRERQQELKKLRALLASRVVDGELLEEVPLPDRSLGDQSTAAPPARSIGDEETRA